VTLDLQPFCSKDSYRPMLHKPFSRGEFSYACEGAMMIRVARRDDVPEIEGAPHAEKVFDPQWKDGEFEALPADFPVPDRAEDDCRECDGHGSGIHDCPDCDCDCEVCDGTGKVEAEAYVSVRGRTVNAKFVRLIKMLPNPKFAVEFPKDENAPISFAFDGGCGLLATVRRGMRKAVAEMYPSPVNDARSQEPAPGHEYKP
jgi:hypothetical protein